MYSIIEKYCTPEWKEFITFHSENLKFGPERIIFNIGEKTEGLYIIKEGKVKISKQTPSGKTRIIRLASDGDILGHRGFGGSWEYSITATTLVATEVLFIPINIFNQVIKANPNFGFHMMMFFAEELRHSERLANQCPVKNLVAGALLTSLDVFGTDDNDSRLSYTLSRKDIASMAGTTYESVVRSLAELQKEEAIKIDGKSIHILSRKTLINIVENNG